MIFFCFLYTYMQYCICFCTRSLLNYSAEKKMSELHISFPKRQIRNFVFKEFMTCRGQLFVNWRNSERWTKIQCHEFFCTQLFSTQAHLKLCRTFADALQSYYEFILFTTSKSSLFVPGFKSKTSHQENNLLVKDVIASENLLAFYSSFLCRMHLNPFRLNYSAQLSIGTGMGLLNGTLDEAKKCTPSSFLSKCLC